MKEDVTQVKAPAVTPQLLQMRMNVEIRCSLKTKMAVKSEKNNTKRYSQFSSQKLFLS